MLVDIVKTQDANTVETSDMVQETMDDLMVVLPEDTEVTYTYDGAVQIDDSISDMIREGLLGAIFAFLVILLFLRNWRSTLIAAVSIPLSVVISLLFMNWAGVTMNVMTLGGLTVAIGRVVDDSIVVIDSGKVIAGGTADELKDQIGGDRLVVTIANPDNLGRAAESLAGLATGAIETAADQPQLFVPISAGGGVLPRAIRSLDEANCQVIDVELRRPSLDDVFLTLTGRTTASEDDGQGRT